MLNRTWMGVSAAALFAFAGVSCKSDKPEGPGEEVAALTVDGVTATASVTAIDTNKRTVTLKWEGGESRTYAIGKEAVNFHQVKIGDVVRASVVEALAIFIGPAGAAPSEGAGTTVALAAKGEKPAMIVANTVVVVDKITHIDQRNRVVTLERAEGLPRNIKVAPGVDLGGLRVGDNVAVRVTEAVAITVSKS